MSDPFTSRAIKVINIAVLFALAVAVCVVYWYAWRPLAKTSGTLNAPVTNPVSVTFDTVGVPHIKASSAEGAFFAQGYCTAQERIFQMDLLRRYNAGELAEIFGPQALESDRESRRLRLRRIAENAYLTLPTV